MKDILGEIVAYKRIEVERIKKEVPESTLRAAVERLGDTPQPSLKAALMQSDTGIIAEFKRRSPSKGWINEGGLAAEIPIAYQQGGAAAVSILTDEKFFGGADEYIIEARKAGVTLPVLYKNFVIDSYQLLQARLCGASAVLLIASVLGKAECSRLIDAAHELGLEVLLELHSERELDYAGLKADMLGVNNRNLGTFITDVNNSFRLASLLPEGVCKVSESGISDPETIVKLRQAGFNGFLIGETFMKNERPGDELKRFIGEVKRRQKRNERNHLTIKVCGLMDAGNALDIAALGVDMTGFIFYEGSRRHVSAERMDAVCTAFDRKLNGRERPLKVGVFVDADTYSIVSAVKRYALDCVQMHGNEDTNRLAEIREAVNAECGRGIKIIKAIAVACRADVEGSAEYAGTADMLLFDTKGKAAGGNGTRFDWSLLRAYSGSLPFLIGGGISPDDAADIRHFNHPQFAGIDLNSRFETSPGIKDITALTHFIEEVRK